MFRVQDSEGRGPFRPGLPRLWVDETSDKKQPPSIIEEFPLDIFETHGRPGEHFATAVRTLDALCEWFLPSEMRTLAMLGFRVAEFRDARVIGESPHQLVVARSRPFAEGFIARRWP